LIAAINREKKMSRTLFERTFPALLLVLLAGTAGTATAQVKRVQMHIAGYLCGN
jgi:hypothetical protein